MIICLEGPSAVGKTSTSRLLSERLGATVISEVNALFKRSETESETWYLERQIDRWNMAVGESAAGRLVVLDGDPFQPLWYNWSYGFVGLQSLEALRSFYRPAIVEGLLSFPDIYVHLTAEEGEIRRRKDADATRSRRNFEDHLRLLTTQTQYFNAMSFILPSIVERVHTVTVQQNVSEIDRIITNNRCVTINSLALFDRLTDWLS